MFGRPKQRGSKSSPRQYDALLFDTFGTTVDWRGSLGRYAARLGAERGLSADWDALVAEWRSLYKPALKPVREGKRPWANFETLHRETLDALLPKYRLTRMSEADRNLLVRGWRALLPWPEAAEGLRRLRAKFVDAPLSNGTVAQLVEMARFGGLGWDAVFGADLWRTYKPAPELYQGAVALLGTRPERVVMVAAHNQDLLAARENGLRTAFVRRSTEDPESTGDWDWVVSGFDELAGALGAE